MAIAPLPELRVARGRQRTVWHGLIQGCLPAVRNHQEQRHRPDPSKTRCRTRGRLAMPTLETISDETGKVVVGWVDDRVLYARFEGGMSADLGARFATHVALLVAKVRGVRYFADAHA